MEPLNVPNLTKQHWLAVFSHCLESNSAFSSPALSRPPDGLVAQTASLGHYQE
jgi:hypothetical protein